MSDRVLTASLNALATGDADVRSARSAIRSAMRKGGDMVDAAYAALRDATFRIVSARERDEEIPVWYDLSTHAASLAQEADRADVSARISALSELIAHTGRFADRQPVVEVLKRKHSATLLAALSEGGGEVPRASLVDRVGLAEANLSRLLGILSTHGLVARRREGKEAYIRLTQGGLAAAGKLGLGASRGARGQGGEWTAVSWPVGVWDRDGEPVEINEAMRGFAKQHAFPSPSMLDYERWTKWLGSVVLESHDASYGGMRNLRLPQDRWFRLSEDRLPDGARIAMLVDISSEIQSKERLDRQLGKANEQIAALKAQLAAAQARQEDSERRLMSFTYWLEFLKTGVVEETVSLGTRLRGWADRLRGGKLRMEAEIADRQIEVVRRALQTLLYTDLHGEHFARNKGGTLQLVDPQSLISQQVKLASSLSGQEVNIHLDDSARLGQVRANVPVIEATVGLAILAFVREHAVFGGRPVPCYRVQTMLSNNCLEVVCVMRGEHDLPDERADFDYYNRHAYDPVADASTSHAHDVAESIGGKVQTGRDHSFVLMSLPVIMVAARPRRARAVLAKA